MKLEVDDGIYISLPELLSSYTEKHMHDFNHSYLFLQVSLIWVTLFSWAMASAKFIFNFFIVSVFLLLVLPGACDAFLLKRHRHRCGFDAIYQLGDSISDTGNLIQEDPASLFARLPYGETFLKKPTGRCSNGLLIIDYIGKFRVINLLFFPFFFLVCLIGFFPSTSLKWSGRYQ